LYETYYSSALATATADHAGNTRCREWVGSNKDLHTEVDLWTLFACHLYISVHD